MGRTREEKKRRGLHGGGTSKESLTAVVKKGMNRAISRLGKGGKGEVVGYRRAHFLIGKKET